MNHLDRFIAALEQDGFDGAILSSNNGLRYLSNAVYDDGYLLIANKKAYIITDFRYEEVVRRTASEKIEVICPDCGMLVCMAGLLAEGGCHRIAVEENRISLATFERLQKVMDGITLAGGASAILDRLRVCKTDEEIAAIKRAQAITDGAFAHILTQMTPNMTEIDVALELEHYMRRQGSEGVAFETIAVSGTESALPHGRPRPVKLEAGFLTMDFGARVDGYCSDMTRTVVIGKADAEMKRLYDTVLTAQCAALDAAAEGVSCQALDKIARDIIEGAGYHKRFGHSLGHGVGMYVHEAPRLAQSAKPEDLLLRGHVVTVEPGIYITGKHGCRIEDMIAVQSDGSVYNFTHSKKELIELF